MESQELTVEFLWGRLRNNEDIALIDATVDVWWRDRARVSGLAAIVGLGLREDKELRFSEARVQVTALPALIGTLPLVRYNYPLPGKDPLDGTYAVEGNPGASLKWESTLGAVACDYNLNISGFDGFHWHVDTLPEITVRPPIPLTVQEYFGSWLTPIRQIATFLTGQSQKVTKFTVGRAPAGGAAPEGTFPRRFKVYAGGLGQTKYRSSRPNPLELRPMYCLAELPYDFPLLITRWTELTATLPQALTPYLNTLFLAALPPRAQFLYTVQALEAIHRAVEDPAVYAEHMATRAKVLARSKELGLDKELRTFLHERIDRHGGPSLRRRLENLLSRVPPSIQQVDTANLLAERVPAMRDDLAHGLREYEPTVLLPFIRAMKTLADAHLLQLLDLEPEHALRLSTTTS